MGQRHKMNEFEIPNALITIGQKSRGNKLL